jgi:hypothetical protein
MNRTIQLLALGVIAACRSNGSAVSAGEQPQPGDVPDIGSFKVMEVARRADGRFDLTYCAGKYWTTESLHDVATAALRKECDLKCWNPLADLRRRYKACVLDTECVATKSNFLILNKSGISEAQQVEDLIQRSGCPVPILRAKLSLACNRGECVMDRPYGR